MFRGTAGKINIPYYTEYDAVCKWVFTQKCGILHTGLIDKAHSAVSYTHLDVYKRQTQLFYKMSEKLYQQQAPQGDPNMGGQPGGDPNGGQQYYDADYKVVDDDDQNK